MARLYNLARMTVSVGGTGVITLGPVVTGYLSFADAGVTNGLTISYAINDPTGGGSEVGVAVYSSTGPTLTRTPITSTNANNRINVSTSAQVAIAPAAAELNLLYGFATASTDNAIVRFDGAAGGTQNSTVIIDDTGNISPATNDVGALGTSAKEWSDLFLATGAVINWNAGDVTITHSAGALASNATWAQTGAMTILSGTSFPVGGTTGAGYKLSSNTGLGIYFGSSAPTLSAAVGSLYIRTDGSSTSTRLYVNTNGTTGWTNVVTAT